MSLTAKQEAFCLAYIELGNASEAYRKAYAAGKMKADSIRVNAAKLLARTDIALRIEELRAPAVAAAQFTLEQHLNTLKDLRDAALDAAKFSAAVAAEVARGKASGFYVEKVEHSGEIGVNGLAARLKEARERSQQR